MSGYDTAYYRKKFSDAADALARDMVPAANELAIFEREAAEAKERGTPFPPSYYRNRRDKILERVALGESKARAAFAAARDEAIKDARELRAEAEADRDPQLRIAEEMERARLIGLSRVSSDDLVQQAQDALRDGQPRRAEFLLSVAVDKGYRSFDIDPETGQTALARLTADIQDAIDASEPQRERARAIERTTVAAAEVFAQERRTLLAKHGIGVREDGSIGSGRPGEAARASLSAKVAAWHGGDKQPEGVLPSAPTGGDVGGRE